MYKASFSENHFKIKTEQIFVWALGRLEIYFLPESVPFSVLEVHVPKLILHDEISGPEVGVPILKDITG